jgi:hypothetical protein
MACNHSLLLIHNNSLQAANWQEVAKAVLHSVTSSNKQATNTTSERCMAHPMLPLAVACGATACRHKP